MAIHHFLAGLGLGIGLMAFRARRTSVRDQGLRLVDALDGLPERAEGLARRMRDETRDFAFDAWSRLQDGTPSDEVLAARVRAEISRVAIRPGYLTVLVDQGNVTISGWATPEEFERLIEAVRQVKGVTRVQSQLDAFGHPEEVASPLGAD